MEITGASYKDRRQSPYETERTFVQNCFDFYFSTFLRVFPKRFVVRQEYYRTRANLTTRTNSFNCNNFLSELVRLWQFRQKSGFCSTNTSKCWSMLSYTIPLLVPILSSSPTRDKRHRALKRGLIIVFFRRMNLSIVFSIG